MTVKNPILSQKAIDQVFPVSDETVREWWDGLPVSRPQEIIVRAAIRYQAGIEYASQAADGRECSALMAKVRKFYRRAKYSAPTAPSQLRLF